MFQVAVASRDLPMLEARRAHLGFGSIHTAPPLQERWLPRSVYTVNSRRAHFVATIPFMEQYLLRSAKRVQYERWRDALFEHERAHPSKFGKGPSPCSEPGCDKPVRGRGLCRSHYYRATDADTCSRIATYLGVGRVSRSERRKPHYDDEVQFTVQATRELVEVIVPFMDAHLPSSYKREQYFEWRAMLLDYWERRFRRRRPCIFDGCGQLARAHGLCRRHLWQVRRQ